MAIETGRPRTAARLARLVGAAVVLGAVLAGAAPAGHAADGNGRFAVKGAGAAPCSTFLNARAEKKTAQRAVFQSWLDGYLSAHNRLSEETYDMVAWQNKSVLMAVLEVYCKKNPDKRFYTAVSALARTLQPDRIVSLSKFIETESGDKKVVIYRETMRRVQKALARLGFYAGKIDGRFGPNTRLGLEAYQQKEKLQITGLPDQRTLYHLLAKK